MSEAAKAMVDLDVRSRRWVLFPLLLLIAVACDAGEGGQGGAGGAGQFLAAIERKSGLIAYVGLNGNIYTINQGGGRQRAITQDARLRVEGEEDGERQSYLFPTWSKGSKTLAFAGVYFLCVLANKALTLIFQLLPETLNLALPAGKAQFQAFIG